MKNLAILDIYSENPALLLNNKKKLYSEVGGLLTIISISCIFVFAFLLGKDVIYKATPSMIYYADQQSSIDSLTTYTTSYFGLGFTLDGADETYDGTYDMRLTYVNFSKNATTNDWDGNYTNVPLITCKNDTYNINGYFSDVYLQYMRCIDEDFMNKFQLGGSYEGEQLSYFYFEFMFCSNSSESSEETNSSSNCKPIESQINLLNGLNIAIYWLESYVTPKDYLNPIKSKFYYFYSYINPEQTKSVDINFSEIEVNTDVGWLLEDFVKLTAISSDSIIIDNFKYGAEVEGKVSSNLVDVYFYKNQKKLIYYRSYIKITTVFANLGGILKLFFIINAVILSNLNSIRLNSEIMSEIYDFRTVNQDKSLKELAKHRLDNINKISRLNINVVKKSKIQNSSNTIKDDESNLKTLKEKDQKDQNNCPSDLFKVKSKSNFKPVPYKKSQDINQLSDVVINSEKHQIHIVQSKAKKLNKSALPKLIQEIEYDLQMNSRLIFSNNELLKLSFCCKNLHNQKLKIKHEIYKSSLSTVSEYLNINTLVKKIREIEAIKYIIFNSSQIESFFFLTKELPKFSFSTESKHLSDLTLTADERHNKIKKVISYFGSKQKISKDSYDSKILELIDLKILDQITKLKT